MSYDKEILCYKVKTINTDGKKCVKRFYTDEEAIKYAREKVLKSSTLSVRIIQECSLVGWL